MPVRSSQLFSDLGLRTTSRVVVIGLLVSTIVVLALGSYNYVRSVEQTRHRLEELGLSSAKAAGLALFNLDQTALSLIGTGLIEHDDVGKVQIIDTDIDDRLFLATVPGYDETVLFPLNPEPFVFELNSDLDLAHGLLVLNANAKQIEGALIESLIFIAISTIVAGMVIAGSIFVIVGRTVVTPVVRLTAVTEAIERGELEEHGKLTGHGRDELGRLEMAIRGMAQALIHHSEDLESKVHERTEELKRSQRELVEREKLAALGSLVAGVAHEVNTPLGSSLMVATTLDSNTDQIRQAFERDEITEDQFTGYLSSMNEGCRILRTNLERASELVKKFKQVAVDQSSHQRRPFGLREAIEDNIATVKPGLRRMPIDIRVDVPERIDMDSYPGALGQVIINLVQNAAVHAFEGRSHGTIEVAASASEPGWISIMVADDGIGMPENVKRRIFEPFFTTKLGQGGSGLGMHIVFNIVTTLLGGRVRVHSKPGGGSRFMVELPIQAPVQQDAA